MTAYFQLLKQHTIVYCFLQFYRIKLCTQMMSDGYQALCGDYISPYKKL